jgi:predicted dehydrogenase
MPGVEARERPLRPVARKRLHAAFKRNEVRRLVRALQEVDFTGVIMDKPFRYGLIGCGGFGRFCLSQYMQMPDFECTGVSDINPALAQSTAAELGVKAWESSRQMLSEGDMDIVHLATPPFTHEELGMAAMDAGKHVLVEKPLAITMEAATALQAHSRKTGCMLSVNLMMRHSPLCQAVKALIDSGLLGDALHAHFINDAKDEKLPPGHWFWDPKLSGGIFVEHGVHFFDLFEWWFGPGKVVAAQELSRPDSSIIEQVHCTAVFSGGTLANFYHGFHQAERRDQQEWLIVFENGTLRMRDWVPTIAELDFLATEADASRIAGFFPGANLVRTTAYEGEESHFTSRHRPRVAEGRFFLTTAPVEKSVLYGDMVRALLREQLAAIRDPHSPRLVTGENGISSLTYAIEAQRLARRLARQTSPVTHS